MPPRAQRIGGRSLATIARPRQHRVDQLDRELVSVDPWERGNRDDVRAIHKLEPDRERRETGPVLVGPRTRRRIICDREPHVTRMLDRLPQKFDAFVGSYGAHKRHLDPRGSTVDVTGRPRAPDVRNHVCARVPALK